MKTNEIQRGTTMKLMNSILVVLMTALIASQTFAQGTYPNRPVRWVVPYAAGGGADVIARPVAIKLAEALGQQIIFDNRGGGGSLIGSEFAARSTPDGYTLLIVAGATHLAPLFYEKLSFDPFKDFTPITNFTKTPNLLVTHPAFPAKNIAEMVAYGRANPGKINWASSGNGTNGHFSLMIFSELAGVKIVHVPFKGAGPAAASVLGGQTDLLFAGSGVFLSQIKAGKMRALAVGGSRRLEILPDIQSFQEVGYPGFESGFYCGLVAPAGTPRPIVNKLHAELVKILTSPEETIRLQNMGTYAVANSPEQFAAELQAEFEKYGKLVKSHNIKAD